MDIDKLRSAFPQTTVFKDQSLIATFKAAGIPAFLRDWILKRKAGADGRIGNKEDLRRYVNDIIPQKEDKLGLIDNAIEMGHTKKFLAKVNIEIDLRKKIVTFEIPTLGIAHRETLIEDYIWDKIKDEVIKTSGGWGLLELSYLPPDRERINGCKHGRLTLLEFKNFCPYKVNIDAFREARRLFTAEEWMDVILGAIDYNPEGYKSWVEKHTMITRLLPFVQPNLNLVELAPKGTGKSYLYGSVGKYGWLVSGGTLSRAKMFRDIARGQDGLIATNDFVALDEIQSILFPEPSEMQGSLKAYMEQGYATFGKDRVAGKAGVIVLGNIPAEDMNETKNMFHTLPSVFHESALIDRFHGFIKGRNIPRMKEKLKMNGWALNSEYFSEIMHLLRADAECLLYRSVVEDLLEYPSGADTRDTEAVFRLCSAYLKLLFPHFTNVKKVNVADFVEYCLRPAVEMRRIIRNQLQLIDSAEYGKKNMALYRVRNKFLNNEIKSE